MVTQPSINFNTPSRIIREAMYNANLLADGDDPLSEHYAKYLPRLNDLVNLWQTQGLKLWLNRMLTLALVAGTATYTLAAREMRVLEGYYFDANNLSRPLDLLAWNDYNTLSNQTEQGTVTGFFPQKLQSTTTVTLWLVPDATAALGSVKLLVQDPVTNTSNLTDDMGFPTEWYMALHWGLSAEICTGQPPSIVQRCETRAEMYRTALENWDVEDAPTRFAPSYRGGFRSRFTR